MPAATLSAEAETSVLDPVECAGCRSRPSRPRDGRHRDGRVLVDLSGRSARRPESASPVWGWMVCCALSATMRRPSCSPCKPARESGTVPLWPVANLRWHLAVRRRPVVVPPTAAWPPGSEAYARALGVARRSRSRRPGSPSGSGSRPRSATSGWPACVGTAGSPVGGGSRGSHGCPSCTSGSPRWAGRCSTTSEPARRHSPPGSGAAAESWIRFAVPRTADGRHRSLASTG